jgi:hypothetical protein
LVSYFYHFYMISYEFPKFGKKRKRKKMNSDGLKLAQVGPRTGESAPAVSDLHRGLWRFKKPLKSLQHYCLVSLTFTSRSFPFLSLHNLRSPTVDGGAVAPASPYRPENATTGALVWLTPNSTPNDHFPSINCKVLAPNLSVHDDSANYG